MTDFYPRWLYHATQGAKIFITEAELIEAEAQGWRDSPGAATALALAAVAEPVIEPSPDDGVLAALDASEAALADAEVVEALEAAEDLIIEKVQAAVAKKRKRK